MNITNVTDYVNITSINYTDFDNMTLSNCTKSENKIDIVYHFITNKTMWSILFMFNEFDGIHID